MKKLKHKMLRVMENESNTYDIVVREYVANVDLAITTESIQAIGKLHYSSVMSTVLLIEYFNSLRWKRIISP